MNLKFPIVHIPFTIGMSKGETFNWNLIFSLRGKPTADRIFVLQITRFILFYCFMMGWMTQMNAEMKKYSWTKASESVSVSVFLWIQFVEITSLHSYFILAERQETKYPRTPSFSIIARSGGLWNGRRAIHFVLMKVILLAHSEKSIRCRT